MSESVELLDCTLRDGAYIVKSYFGAAALRGIILHMQEAGAEIVECGWLKDTEHEYGSSFYHTPRDLEQYLVKRRQDVSYVVMIDWDRYDLQYLTPYDGKSIDAIRVVFPHGKHREAIEVGKAIKEKGYRLFFQAANTLAYSDEELDELAAAMNEAGPESLSVVDTFGAMYTEDLERIALRLDKTLAPGIKLGFHSHNNQQLSFALSMHFVQMFRKSSRKLVVDASLCGMGRGAGNATTELMASWLNRKLGKHYDLDMILDAIDVFMEYFKKNYSWGYSTPYFISGTYCTHVNNIAYLREKHRTNARDMKNIIASLPAEKRLVYDYDLLEKKYLDYYRRDVGTEETLEQLRSRFANRKVLMLCSGQSLREHADDVQHFIRRNSPVTIGINAMFREYPYDFCFFSNPIRYAYFMMTDDKDFLEVERIVTSNIRTEPGENEHIMGFNRLLKCGWKYFDNAGILCLRMLQLLHVKEVALAGFDGFKGIVGSDYADDRMPTVIADDDWAVVNRDIIEMLADFRSTDGQGMHIEFITPSIFA